MCSIECHDYTCICNLQDSLSLMSTYLPKDSSSNSAYQEGGGLYALGLIHANHGKGKITEYLLEQLKSATSEVGVAIVMMMNTHL